MLKRDAIVPKNSTFEKNVIHLMDKNVMESESYYLTHKTLYQMENKVQLPNATAILVLGICSIVFGCVLVGLVCGIIGLVLSSKSLRLYKEDPNKYEGYGTVNAGRIMSIIGVVLGSLYTLYFLIVLVFLGAMLPWSSLMNV